MSVSTARAAGLALCHVCQHLTRWRGGHPHCPRCGAALHLRKPDSLARSWALLIAAYVLFIPANVLPVMTVTMLGHGEPDTILSGVMALIAARQWPLAILVFFASITVPLLKLLGLSYLLLTLRSPRRRRDRTVLYRVVEAVGRWSMIDIFMISILAALVRLGAIATIQPGPGATSFAAVVVLTMVAAMSFDPRLIWDTPDADAD